MNHNVQAEAAALLAQATNALASLTALLAAQAAAPPATATCKCGQPKPSVSSIIRDALAADPAISDAALATKVRAIRGDWPSLNDTVSRLRRRIESTSARPLKRWRKP